MRRTNINSVADVFAALGGTSTVARLLGVGPSTASEMKRRGRVPAEYWCDLIAAARRQGSSGVTLEMLATLHARKSGADTPGGFSEEDTAAVVQRQADSAASDRGEPSSAADHFSRWKHLRRSHFVSGEEIDAHVGALRDEWDRR